MVLESLNINFSSYRTEYWTSLQDLFSGIYKLAFKSKENPNRETVDFLQSQHLDINSKVFKTSSLKVKETALQQEKEAKL